ncbi:MAG: phosphoribosylanthranilate isomerase [Flavobacteriaceae bacterium]|jgi:phosphoribosylanthranilate isomerase|uniref:phosphoribosylanthranilate isomerase n=1 Tax=Candidatus Marifrigoribacter sp. Uisw_064 TaxID=3230970 RepID=UPI003AEC8779
MKVKVCGMKYSENINQVAMLNPDYMGFIFYKKSSRFVNEIVMTSQLKKLPKSIKKVGVFVNETRSEIETISKKYKLDLIQLHGDESPVFCENLKEGKLKIIKAFQIDDQFNFSLLNEYEGTVDYFLFDTKSKSYGGSGRKFNWSLLSNYSYKTPFFLSGGINEKDISEIKKIKTLTIEAIDINSCFEISPALKNIPKVSEFIKRVKNEL